MYARRQREALLSTGFVPNPVGRPKKDPEAIRRTCAHRERGSDYKEYQKLSTIDNSEPAGELRVGC